MTVVALIGLRELAYRWRLALACLLLVAVPVMLYLSLRVFLAGMRSEYASIGVGMLVVQKSDSMGEVYGSRLGPEIAAQLRDKGYSDPIAAIHEVAGTSITNAVLLRGVDLTRYQRLEAFQVLAGEALNPDSPPRSAMIGYRLAEARELAVGDSTLLRGRNFQVTGIFQTGTYLDNQAWISMADAQALFQYGQDVSIFVIPEGGALRAGDILPGGLVVAQRGELVQQISEEYLSIVNFMGWVVRIQAAATAVMLSNILWRMAWQRRRELSILRSLGFGSAAPWVYLVTQAGAIVLLGSLLGYLGAETLGKEMLQKVAGFGLQTILDPAGWLDAVWVSLGILAVGVAAPLIWMQRMNLVELLRSE